MSRKGWQPRKVYGKDNPHYKGARRASTYTNAGASRAVASRDFGVEYDWRKDYRDHQALGEAKLGEAMGDTSLFGHKLTIVDEDGAVHRWESFAEKFGQSFAEDKIDGGSGGADAFAERYGYRLRMDFSRSDNPLLGEANVATAKAMVAENRIRDGIGISEDGMSMSVPLYRIFQRDNACDSLYRNFAWACTTGRPLSTEGYEDRVRDSLFDPRTLDRDEALRRGATRAAFEEWSIRNFGGVDEDRRDEFDPSGNQEQSEILGAYMEMAASVDDERLARFAARNASSFYDPKHGWDQESLHARAINELH